jgi:hypothetical protein
MTESMTTDKEDINSINNNGNGKDDNGNDVVNDDMKHQGQWLMWTTKSMSVATMLMMTTRAIRGWQSDNSDGTATMEGR